MLVQIRGNSGSGKTTIMKKLLDDYGPWDSTFIDGRRKPYFYSSKNGHRIGVVGHYESPCGGCDNIGSAPQSTDAVRVVAINHEIVLAEGLLLSEDYKWTAGLGDDFPVRVIFLTTDFDTCIERIKKRREAAGNFKELSLKLTTNRVRSIRSARRRLRDCPSVTVYDRSPDQAYKLIRKWLDEV